MTTYRRIRLPRVNDFKFVATNAHEQGLNSTVVWECPPGFIRLLDSCVPEDVVRGNQMTLKEGTSEMEMLDKILKHAIRVNNEKTWTAYRKALQEFRRNLLERFWTVKPKSGADYSLPVQIGELLKRRARNGSSQGN